MLIRRKALRTSALSAFALAALWAAEGAAQVEGAPAQQVRDTAQADEQVPHRMTPITVTATRAEVDVFAVPAPVQVIDRSSIREMAPNTAADLFRELPGLDASGVGANQVRPIIRGQRGQRILMLENGLPLNNSRRQQDFGEVPALVDVSSIERVEIVRGPSSVLYGSDAIGGVVNLITRTPDVDGLHGSIGYRFSSHDNQQKAVANLAGRFGRLEMTASGTVRDAEAYDAPAGSFGDITLNSDTRVNDSGVQDDSFTASVGYRLLLNHKVSVRFERYRADTSGFGFVDAEAFAPGDPLIQILYPVQRFDKVTATYEATNLMTFFADKVSFAGYFQDNERRLNLNIFVPFGPAAPPGAGVQVNTRNFTDLHTAGFRLETSKLVTEHLVLTYGVDFLRDNSDNGDTSVTTILGFGPPIVQQASDPLVPAATLRNVGAFLQGDLRPTSNFELILGVRYQDVRAETKLTEGLSDPLVDISDRTVVGAANAIYSATDNLNIIGSIGRAFRSPNLVERFFNGPTPEGQAFQVRNPDLQPETSLNLDLGLRYRDQHVLFEGFVFRNEIRDGIRISPTGNVVNGIPEFENVNVDELLFTGVELTTDVRLGNGISVGADYTRLRSRDELNPNNPVGESFANKINGRLRYTDPADRFWAEYRIRHNSDRKDVELGINPLGSVLPAFTVHTLRGGLVVFRRGDHVQRIGIAITNLTNELYAEFSNASFFRPEPKRGVTLTWDMSF